MHPVTNPIILQCRKTCFNYDFCDCDNSQSYLKPFTQYWYEAIKNVDIVILPNKK